MNARSCWVLAALLLVAFLAPEAQADAVRCEVLPDSVQSPQYSVEKFFSFRPGAKGQDLIYRDVEFLWDSLYVGGLTEDVQSTLRNLAHTLVDSAGRNPFGAPISDFHLIYDYFRREGGFYNPTDPKDTASVVVGSFC